MRDPEPFLAGRHQTGTGVGSDDSLDQLVNNRIGNPGQVLRSFYRSSPRGKIAAQRITGGGGKAEPLYGEIEIEIIDAFAVLHRIDNAQIGVDPKCSEVLDERRVMGLERRLVDQELRLDRLALGGDALAALDRVSGLLQQRARPAQQAAVLA